MRGKIMMQKFYFEHSRDLDDEKALKTVKTGNRQQNGNK